jgi:hypothetical protein
MLRRSLLLSLLIASATCGADELPAAEPMANAAPETAAASKSGPGSSAAAKAAPAKSAPSDAAQAKAADGAGGGDKALSGMSILGNQEAPKSLVIVPWKSSAIGDTLGLDESLDDGRRPVDKEVFMRELDYYEIRSGSK